MSSKRLFYYNRKTRESSLNAPQVDVNPPGYTKRKSKVIRNNYNKWVKVFSTDYNQVYYFNKASRTSVWDNPDPENTDLRDSVAVIEP